VECVAATSEREQQSSLYDLDTHYGTVAGLEEVLAIFGSARENMTMGGRT
jgi:hypothetical protein